MKNTRINTAKKHSFLAITIVTAILFSFIACEEGYTPPPPDPVPVIGIDLDKDTLSLIKGETEKLTAAINPINADNTTVTWSSSKTSVATVHNGVVTAVSSGITVITVTTADGGKTAKCNVYVYIKGTSTQGLEMMQIPAGDFIMGQIGLAAPTHKVTLSGFYMGKYQVTQEQYQAVIGTNPSDFKTSGTSVTGESGTPGKLPVENVSWYDALVFCNKLSVKEGLSPAYSISGSTDPADWGTVPTNSDAIWDAVIIVTGSNGYRLPTEAQWEYACRAGTTTAYNTGDTVSDNTGWYGKNSNSMTHRVGLKPANAFGLYDMHGNVFEWCWDWHGVYVSAAQTNPVGASSGSYRVIRGGSWLNVSADNLRSAYRGSHAPNSWFMDLGFRLIRPL
jgi:formylglycine-generating enzyme required for sulfatase activity